MNRLAIVITTLLATLALAEVGTVAALEGVATRTPEGGKAEALKAGSLIELHDTITVTSGNLKFELNDGSIIMLAPKSVLEIRDAVFEGQERKSFGGFLRAGSLWTKVKKALGAEKFEVSTERAVAGVRGTIFRIDADALIKAANRKASIVRVIEGAVAVTSTVPPTKKKATGPRQEVAGPKEVTKDEYEAIVATLQANQQIVVGVDLFEQSQIDEAANADAFSKWIEKNR